MAIVKHWFNYTQALFKSSLILIPYYCIVKSAPTYNVSLLNDFASMTKGGERFMIIFCVGLLKMTPHCGRIVTSQTIPFTWRFTDDRYRSGLNSRRRQTDAYP